MIFSDIEKAKEILLDIGYYRLGFYWFPYEKTYPSKHNRTHFFTPQTLFDDIITLYYFDQDLRNTLAPYLYRIEINFRTYIIYTVSNYYKNNPVWFADHRVVSNNFISHLANTCYNTINKNEAIKEHHKKHLNDKYAPAWKTIEYMTFGDIIYLYQCLKDKSVKQLICKHYNINNIDVFENYMSTLRVLRNLCAHGHNIYDLKLRKRIKKGPIKSLNGSMYNNLSGVLSILFYILNTISSNRTQELKYKLKLLVNQNNVKNIESSIVGLKTYLNNAD